MKTIASIVVTSLVAIALTARAFPPEQLLDTYAQITGKTLLRPTFIPTLKLTNFYQPSTNQQETVRLITNAFAEIGYEFAPAGDKFMEVMPVVFQKDAQLAAQLARFQPPPAASNTNENGGVIRAVSI